ncbi:queuosine precursor transporter [Leptolyngbya sp. FACHB-261]|uniref:queuosine precursor transporter n=1 Tax=Leptolyngbya sp. FACHB-261 TaxID=2692806 RepID=UPI0016826C88|nr:queuosine precursor transporter [Leptolyngbya sp. FACHB-261]MBD2102977.1 queuosine precursor transporter [Leptolyngbya sp. FACHB-261]
MPPMFLHQRRYLNATIYIVAVLAANYTATWFIPLPIFGQVAVGTFIFGVTFTQRDRMHMSGRRFVYQVIALTALLCLLESLLLKVPSRIIFASLTGIVLSEIADTEVYQRLLKRSWVLRVAGSNAVSIPIDTLLFNVLAFAGVFPLAQLIGIMWGELLVKAISSTVATAWRVREFSQVQ